MKTGILLSVLMFAMNIHAGDLVWVKAWPERTIPNNVGYVESDYVNRTGREIYVTAIKVFPRGYRVTPGTAMVIQGWVERYDGSELVYWENEFTDSGYGQDQYLSFRPDYFELGPGERLVMYVRSRGDGAQVAGIAVHLWYTLKP
jgi:hypothetical protein